MTNTLNRNLLIQQIIYQSNFKIIVTRLLKKKHTCWLVIKCKLASGSIKVSIQRLRDNDMSSKDLVSSSTTRIGWDISSTSLDCATWRRDRLHHLDHEATMYELVSLIAVAAGNGPLSWGGWWSCSHPTSFPHDDGSDLLGQLWFTTTLEIDVVISCCLQWTGQWQWQWRRPRIGKQCWITFRDHDS